MVGVARWCKNPPIVISAVTENHEIGRYSMKQGHARIEVGQGLHRESTSPLKVMFSFDELRPRGFVMTTALYEGGCLCGAIRYRITGAPRARSLCHCRSCQRAAGAPSVAWVVMNHADFAFVAGRPVVFRSSPGVLRTFCGTCGTSLTYQREAEPQTIDATTATLDSPNDFAPTREIWLTHKLNWERANDTMAHYAESSRGAVPL